MPAYVFATDSKSPAPQIDKQTAHAYGPRLVYHKHILPGSVPLGRVFAFATIVWRLAAPLNGKQQLTLVMSE